MRFTKLSLNAFRATIPFGEKLIGMFVKYKKSYT